ncbi:MAG: hypothetical protein ACM30I_06790 [Gemmatimonas sp.]
MTRGAVLLIALSGCALAGCAAPPAAVPRAAQTGSAPATATPVVGYSVRPTPPPSGKLTLESLTGMNAGGVTNLLGPPQFRRRDGQVEIWQYRGPTCTLDLFLYTESGDMRVRYVEPRGRTVQASAAEQAEVRACATGLLQAKAGS